MLTTRGAVISGVDVRNVAVKVGSGLPAGSAAPSMVTVKGVLTASGAVGVSVTLRSSARDRQRRRHPRPRRADRRTVDDVSDARFIGSEKDD